MKLTIETIDHQDQRYPTAGDWELGGTPENPEITVKVSDLGDWRKEFLIGIHEAIETVLCIKDGVKDEDVCAFDEAFEEARKTASNGRFIFRGLGYPEDYEPGDAVGAPYQNQHNFATAVERMVCAALGMTWHEYEDAVLGLPEWEPSVP
jgi:hypothetical protein